MNNSLNHIYRVVWNASLGLWQVASEVARNGGKTQSEQRKTRRLKVGAAAISGALAGAFAGLASIAIPSVALAQLPTGGQVVGGQASIVQNGKALNINQTTDRAAIDWQSFNVGQGNTVNFNQPSASSIALNRVLGSDVSVIQGAINANGQVFLVNQNGILFTPTAQVNVGGIVASTQSISTADFMAGNHTFSGSSAGTVENQGNITTSNGGTVALIAAKIINTGTITAPQGTVGLAAGNTVTLDLGGPVKIQVTQGALNTAIEQGGGIVADGGQIYLTAKAADNLAASAINHIGITRARTLAGNQKGEIILIADMEVGTTTVAGTLDASAPNVGDGGFIETSAANVKIQDGANITTSATKGKNGQWLIDPHDFTIAASGGDITGAALGTALANNSVTIQTLASSVSCTGATCGTGKADGNGDIHVNDSVSWGGATTLTLKAHRNININENITSSHANGKLALEVGQGSTAASYTGTSGNAPGDYYIVRGRSVSLQAGQNFSLKRGSDGTTKTFTVLRYDPAVGQTNNLISANDFAGNFALGSDVLLSSGVYIFGQANGSSATNYNGYNGEFHGLGHSVKGFNVTQAVSVVSGFAGSLSAAPFLSYQVYGTVIRDITIDKPAINISAPTPNSNVFVSGLLGQSRFAGGGGSDSAAGARTTVSGVYVVDADFSLTKLPNGSPAVAGIVAGSAFSSAAPGSLVVQDSLVTGKFVIESNDNVTNFTPTFGGIVASHAFMQRVGFDGTVTISSAATGTGTLRVGGLAGANGSNGRTAIAINNSYSRGTFTLSGRYGSSSSVGGLHGALGANSSATGADQGPVGLGINNSVVDNTWIIDGLSLSGGTLNTGLFGNNSNNSLLASTFNNLYYNSNKVPNGWRTATPLGTGLAPTGVGTAQFATQSNFEALDFNNIWVMSTNGPVLRVHQVKPFAPAAQQVFIRLDCGLCESIYGETPQFSFKAFDAATGGAEVSNAMLTGTALYSLTNGGIAAGTELGRLTDAGTYAVTYTSGLTGASMYQLSAGAAANFTIKPKLLTVAIQAALGSPLSKVYDGKENIALVSNNFVISGFVDQQGVGATLGGVTSGTFNSKNVLQATTISADLGQATLSGTAQGFKYSNYSLPTGPVTVAGTITAKGIAVSGLTAQNKTYDGNRNAVITGTAVVDTTGVIQGDTVNVTGTVTGGLFADKDAGNDKAVSVSGLSLSGTDAGNYSIAPANLKANITQKALTISGTTVANKDYDGNTNATVTVGTLIGVVEGETLGTTTATGQFAGKDVVRNAQGTATAQNVTVAYTLANGTNTEHKASNYTLASETKTATINPKALTIAGSTVANKTYDGNTTAQVTVGTLQGLVEGETLGTSTAAGSFADKDAGDSKNVTVAYTLVNGANANHMASNYSLANETLTAKINKKTLTFDATSAIQRQYDGTTAVSLGPSSVSINGFMEGVNGLVGNESFVSIPGAPLGRAITAVGTFADADVGSNKSISNIVFTFGAGINGGLASNYAPEVGTLQGSILPREIVLSGATITAASKTFDNNTNATVTMVGGSLQTATFANGTYNFGPAGQLIGTERLGAITATGSFGDANAGNDKAVTLTYTVASGTAGDGFTAGKASNYKLLTSNGAATIPTPFTVTANILKRQLTLSGATITAANKTYDGLLGTAVAIMGGTLSNLATGDTALGAITASGVFADKDAGNGKNVTVSYVLSDGPPGSSGRRRALASNYFLADTTTGVTANINQKQVSISEFAAEGKTYDGNTTATIANAGKLVGVVEGDAAKVALSNTGATFDTKDAGTAKTVTLNGKALTGDEAKNYVLAKDAVTAKADIAQKQLTVTGFAADGKTYDGNTTATIANAGKLVGVVEGDAAKVALSNTGATFDTKDAGTAKTVTLNGKALTGDEAKNYVLAEDAVTAKADIAKKEITLAGFDAANKVYDSDTDAQIVSSGSLAGVVSNDTVMVSNSGATFDTKNAGTGKTVTLNGVQLSGTDAGNYSIANTATDTADITKRGGVVLTALNKEKQLGEADPALTFEVTGLVEGDSLTGSLSRVAGETPGFYAINRGTVDNSNYEITQFNAGRLQINQSLPQETIATVNTLSSPELRPSLGERPLLDQGGVPQSQAQETLFLVTPAQANLSGPAQVVVVDGGINLNFEGRSENQGN